jgi:hypothetical protein
LTRLRGRSRFGAAKARASILLQKIVAKKMDCRVKPGNDVDYCFASADFSCGVTRHIMLPTSSATSSAPLLVDADANRAALRVAVLVQKSGEAPSDSPL